MPGGSPSTATARTRTSTRAWRSSVSSTPPVPLRARWSCEPGSARATVGIVHCVGSRDVRYNSYCSRVCCMYSLKLAHLIKERTDADVYNFYIDMRTPGKGYEEFYGKVGKEGVHFIRGRVAEVSDWTISPAEAGKLVIRAEDTLASTVRRIPVDMVVLAVALEPQADAEEVGRLLEHQLWLRGLLHRTTSRSLPRCRRSPTASSWPASARDRRTSRTPWRRPARPPRRRWRWSTAASWSSSRARRSSTRPSAPGVAPASASARSARCPSTRRTKVAVVNEVLCKGCGVCVAACPSGARQQHLFTDEQILAELKGVLEGALTTHVRTEDRRLLLHLVHVHGSRPGRHLPDAVRAQRAGDTADVLGQARSAVRARGLPPRRRRRADRRLPPGRLPLPGGQLQDPPPDRAAASRAARPGRRGRAACASSGSRPPRARRCSGSATR